MEMRERWSEVKAERKKIQIDDEKEQSQTKPSERRITHFI